MPRPRQLRALCGDWRAPDLRRVVADLISDSRIEAAIAAKEPPKSAASVTHQGGCSLAGAAAAAIGTLLENGALELKGNNWITTRATEDLRAATLALSVCWIQNPA